MSSNVSSPSGMHQAWFIGYGSLIFEPCHKGKRLDDWSQSAVDGRINEGVEFLHPSSARSGAPTLTFDGTARWVPVKCWPVVGPDNIREAKKFMKDREGSLRRIDVVLNDGRRITGLCGSLLNGVRS